MSDAAPPHGRRRRKLVKALKLAILAVLGLSTVSIPVTVALLLSAGGTSDLITIGAARPQKHHASAANAVGDPRCVPTRGYYALTFDDGPLAETTPRLVARLTKARAVATFFDIGERAVARPDLVELQRGAGQVANHTYSHPHLPDVSPARRLQELQTTARVLDYPNALLRPPYGETSPETDADIHSTELTPVYWTLDARDARASAKAVIERALRVEPGGIVLLHDGARGAIDAVPGIVAGLRRRGMCPGFIAGTATLITGANGVSFHAIAVKP
jgi:peptidoglycan/xylan/chitin deacetylase (PgdA/CDA1 family)